MIAQNDTVAKKAISETLAKAFRDLIAQKGIPPEEVDRRVSSRTEDPRCITPPVAQILQQPSLLTFETFALLCGSVGVDHVDFVAGLKLPPEEKKVYWGWSQA